MMTRLVLVAAVVAAVVMLAAAVGLALRVDDLMTEELGGFVTFAGAIGILAVTSVAVGVTIVWRVPGNRIGRMLIVGALLMSTVFVVWPLTVIGLRSGAIPDDVLGPLAWWGNVALVPSLFVLFPSVALMFPDGRLPGPAWQTPYRLCVGALMASTVMLTLAPWVTTREQPVPNPFALPGVPPVVSEIGGALGALAVFVAFALAVVGLIVRFRRSDGAERAQVKWLAAAIALLAVVFPLSFATEIGPAGLIDVASVIVGTLVPLAIGVAVLRYRLYDIDRIVSRTLSWAVVTGVLVATFATLVVGLQTLLSDVTTQGGTLAVAVSTLVAFALFQPVRRRVQGAVDRRFDRARYDRDRTAAEFADRLRVGVDLEGVTADLEQTVADAIRPTTATVWLPDREWR